MRRLRFLLWVPLALLAGCSAFDGLYDLALMPSDTTPPPRERKAAPARTPAAPPAIPCSAAPPLQPLVPKPGQEEDRANAFDTPETAAAIAKHNAARKAACP